LANPSIPINGYVIPDPPIVLGRLIIKLPDIPRSQRKKHYKEKHNRQKEYMEHSRFVYCNKVPKNVGMKFRNQWRQTTGVISLYFL